MKHLIACAVAAAAIGASVAPALAADASTATPAGVRVNLDGLNLRTTDGRAAVQQRIDAAVTAYCTVDDPSSRARAAEARCRAAVAPKVRAQVDAMLADPAMGKALGAS